MRGIGPQRAAELARGWREYRALRGIVAFLAAHQLDQRYAHRLLAAYGPGAPAVLAANPYRLVGEVPGLGFRAADRLGRALGVRASAPARLQAAVQATLLRAGEDGHTRLDRRRAGDGGGGGGRGGAGPDRGGGRPADRQRHDRDDGAAPRRGRGAAAGPARRRPSAGACACTSRRSRAAAPGRRGGRRATATSAAAGDAAGLGLLGLVRAEEGLAFGLGLLIGQPSGLAPSAVDAWLARDATARALSDEQRAAVRAAALTRLFVLTGGPGVGKTTTLRALVRCLRATRARRWRWRRRPARRPSGWARSSAPEARTLHRLLGAGPRGFRHGGDDPLPDDVVVVDEASMLDTRWRGPSWRRSGRRAQLILVGDADQLPSVGPGQVLRDLLASGTVPAARLATVFRQAAASQIVANAHRIRRGEPPELAPGRGAAGARATASSWRRPPTGWRRRRRPWAAERLPRAAGRRPARGAGAGAADARLPVRQRGAPGAPQPAARGPGRAPARRAGAARRRPGDPDAQQLQPGRRVQRRHRGR